VWIIKESGVGGNGCRSGGITLQIFHGAYSDLRHFFYFS
jgi:hypothetical protein